ncbi:hypothetical protein CspHIS471_0504350 [Cutaneotrichosporon sp. HIS471]|nr:hypothetical protein CspHIS471_0504350 [Cutaneotrichosporon sp. HIS471]
MSAVKRPRGEDSSPVREKPVPDRDTVASDTVSGPAIRDDEEWTNGDFEVITSDHVRFRVQSYYLLNSVFRDAEAMAAKTKPGSSRLLVLDDEVIETAQVFDQVLELICYGNFEDGYWIPNAWPMVAFLKKWGCDKALRDLVNILKLEAISIISAISPLRIFAIVSIAGRDYDCREFLRLSDFGSFKYREEEDMPEEFARYGGGSLNPENWPMYMYTEVNPTCAWALARAFGEHPDTDGVPGDDFAKSFAKWHNTAEGTKPSHIGCKLLEDPSWR